MKEMYYLASPSSHPDIAIREFRYYEVLKARAWFFLNNIHVYSPIAETHVVSALFSLPKFFEPYRELDFNHISRMDGVYVLCVDGWLSSVGVQAEIKYAESIGKPVRYWGIVNDIANGSNANHPIVMKDFTDVVLEGRCKYCGEYNPPIGSCHCGAR